MYQVVTSNRSARTSGWPATAWIFSFLRMRKPFFPHSRASPSEGLQMIPETKRPSFVMTGFSKIISCALGMEESLLSISSIQSSFVMFVRFVWMVIVVSRSGSTRRWDVTLFAVISERSCLWSFTRLISRERSNWKRAMTVFSPSRPSRRSRWLSGVRSRSVVYSSCASSQSLRGSAFGVLALLG